MRNTQRAGTRLLRVVRFLRAKTVQWFMPLCGNRDDDNWASGMTKNTFGTVRGGAAQGKQEGTEATERENSVTSVSFAASS